MTATWYSSAAPGQFLWYSGSIKSIELHIKHLKPEHPDSTHIVSLASVSQLFTSTVVGLHMSPANILVQAASC